MTFISYAQNFEDVLLWRAVGHIEHGRYLDIGAHDPVVDSVSLAFYHAEWRGTHVEATPYFAARLREARPDEQVIEAAVTDEPGPIEFYEIGDTGLSTGKEEIAKHHLELGFSVRKILVPSIRLDQLLQASEDDLHWLKIDVEGMEADVLRSWGDCNRRPWILVIESTFPNTTRQTHDLWIDQVLSRGYDEVYFDGLSRYFLHNGHAELCEKFQAPANVFDQFSVAPHHFTAAQLRNKADQLQQEIRNREAEIVGLNEEIIATAQRHSTEWRTREICLLHDHEKQLIETRWSERRAADREWLSRVREVEAPLRNAQNAAQSALADAKAELARLRERSRQLEEQLARADAATSAANEQLSEARNEVSTLAKNLDDFRAAAAEAQAEGNRAKAETEALRAETAEAQTERDRAKSETEAVRAEAAKAQLELDRARSETDAVRAVSLREIDQFRDELARETERLNSQIRNAGEMIRAAVDENPTPLRRIGQAFGLVGPSLAWQRLASWSPEVENSEQPPKKIHQSHSNEMESPMHSSASFDACNPYLRANSLPELLSWNDDVDFIRCAYVTVLGRQPDVEGEAYYVDRLREGHSKLAILAELRRSPEGLKHDPGIAGFDRALKRAQLTRLPFIGWFIQLFGSIEGNSAVERNQHIILTQLKLIQSMQRTHALQFTEFETRFSRLEVRIRSFKLVSDDRNSSNIGLELSDDDALISPLPSFLSTIDGPINCRTGEDATAHLSSAAQKIYRRIRT